MCLRAPPFTGAVGFVCVFFFPGDSVSYVNIRNIDIKDIEGISLISRGPPPAGTGPLGIETGARGLMHLLMTASKRARICSADGAAAAAAISRRIARAAAACVSQVSVATAAFAAAVVAGAASMLELPFGMLLPFCRPLSAVPARETVAAVLMRA